MLFSLTPLPDGAVRAVPLAQPPEHCLFTTEEAVLFGVDRAARIIRNQLYHQADHVAHQCISWKMAVATVAFLFELYPEALAHPDLTGYGR